MKRPHLLVFLSLAWLGGIGLARYVPLPGWLWLALAGLAGASLFLWRRFPRLPLVAVGVVAVGLGAARYQAVQPQFGDPAFVASYNDQGQVTLEGVVVDEPDVRDDHVNLRLHADQLTTLGNETPRGVGGLVLVQTARFPVYGYGERLRVSGTLETPPVFEDFSYRDALAREGVHSLLRRGAVTPLAERTCAGEWSAACNPLLQAVFDFKARSLQVVAALFPEPQAALLSGILLGVDAGLPAGVQEAFKATGTTHIIAISGFNVTIIAGVIVFLSRRLAGRHARGRAALLAMSGIALYTVLVGADASVVRAALMAGLALLARLIGRQSYAPGALFFSAALMTAANPLTLWDVGFQLSVMATLGLILYADRITGAVLRWLERFTSLAQDERVAGWVGEYFCVTLAAQLTTLPLILFYFRRLSLISLVANPLILPAQPPVMMLGGLALLGGLIGRPLGTLLAWAAWPFVTYTIAVVEWLGRVPGASLDLGSRSAGLMIGLYGLLFGLTWLASRKAEARPGWLNRLWQRRGVTALLSVLALGAVLTWSAVLTLPDGRLHVVFLDVGDGEAALVQTPSGEYVLIGGGPSPGKLAEGLGRWMPFWQRRLALVVVPGPAEAQVAGLAGTLPRYTVQQAVIVGGAGRSAAYRELIGGLNQRSVPVIEAEAGQEFDLGDGARLRVLSVGGAGVILRLAWGNASFLLPVGEAADYLAVLADSGESLGSTVLLVPEGGSQGVLDLGRVEAISPWAAVVSVDVEGPAAETLAALEGYTVLRTDRNGWVSFVTDGQQLWAEAQR